MTKIKINNNSAEIVEAEFYTSGMVGAKIAFQFSEEWNGLTKTAVFKTDGVQKDVLNVTNVCTIPHECFENAGERLVVGVYGTNGNDVVIPTVYANLGRIKQGADPSGDESTEPSLPVWAQVQGDVSDLDTRVTELEEHGGGGGGGSTVELDTTLTQSGKAADAKAVGDALAGKQNTISDLEAIRTGAAKGATALQSVPSTYRTASEQDTIDNGKVDKVTGKGLSSNDYTDAAKAKVDALAPVATSGSYNDLTNKPTIPTTLPNPNALTFTGAVTGSYDGSAPLSVEIPSGGGSSGGSTAEWQLLGTYTMLVKDRSLIIDLSQFGGITHFLIIGNFPKCSEDCGVTNFYLGTAFNHTNQPSPKQNVYAFNLLAECELVDGQLYGFIGTIDGWTFKVPASVVINTPRDRDKCTSFRIYYTNAVNDTTANTIQIWGY